MIRENGSNEIRRTAFEFTLELDLHLSVTPLMRGLADGSMMTRTLQLPFPPEDRTTIGGRAIQGDCPSFFVIRSTARDLTSRVKIRRVSMDRI